MRIFFVKIVLMEHSREIYRPCSEVNSDADGNRCCYHVFVIGYTQFHGKGILMKRVKEVCTLAGVSKRTLQFYDDLGVLSVSRSQGNERLYSEETLKKLGTILMYKRIGLKLDEIKEMIDLSEEEQKHFLMGHIHHLQEKSIELEKQRSLTNYIVREGIPDFSKIDHEGERITYMEFIDRLVEQICK